MKIPRSIRTHLFQVLLLSIVPIGVFASALMYLHWQAQERERERSQIEAVRALAATVDNVLDSTLQRLSILARLWAASGASDEVIYLQAKAALGANPDWENIVAFRADGSAVFRTDRPFGVQQPGMRLLDMWQPLLDGGQGRVSDAFTSPSRGIPIVTVGVPVRLGDKVSHVLIVTLDLAWFDRLLAGQSQPSSGVAGIFDRNWKFVARSAEGDQRRGADPSRPLVEDMKRRSEGVGKYLSLNGVGVYTSWTPSRHGWWLAWATPSAPVDDAFWNYLALFGALWAMVVVGGFAYAIGKGRHIAAALALVEGRAGELAQAGDPAPLPPSRVAEVNRALAALEQAGRTLADATRERDRLLATEREARGAAEAASRAKDEFLAMLGHELRNPLAAISNAATVIGGKKRSEEHLAFAAGVIQRQTQHLKRLIDDLLDVGRVMTGKIFLEQQPLDLAAAVRHVVETLETAGRLAQRRVELDLAPAWLQGDPTRIEQIATNLLVNAATYTAPGGRIAVRIATRGGEALLEVSDDGRGIAAEDLQRVFELFFQGDATLDRASGGLGIGLTLVRRLVALHGGTVECHSAGRGKGATFTVRLPASAAETASPRNAEARLRAVHAQTMLLVEDNADERNSLRLALELRGHRVTQAAHAQEALALMHRHRPPVAIVDIGLPGMDGYRLAGLARKELGSEMVLIALTGYGGAEDAHRALAAGFDRHLAKPANPQEIEQAIAAALAAKRGQDPFRAHYAQNT